MASAEKAAPAADASAEGTPKKGSKLKLILVILVALLFMVGGGGAVGVFLLGMKLPFMKQPAAEEQADEAQKIDPKEAERREQEKRDAEKAKQKAAATRSLFVPVPPIVVNLADRDVRRYARIVLMVEVVLPESEAAVRENMPKVIDAFQIYVRSLTAESFGSVASILQVRRELLVRLNRIDPRVDARAVLFQDLVIQ
ncbi:flagellar basal body-associated protein FliL [Hyphomonas sp.]|jgi:flagellar FliL protein|uniref:flagellar basal body-associated protein FliL n=1 Tax=Hyphomonas sp. TaxID=87 RepID=UPI0037C036A9